MSYATVADFRAYLEQIPVGAAKDVQIQAVLDRANSVIDTELGFVFGTAAAETRTVYGDGTDYLIPPHFTAGSVTLVSAPSGHTVPDYIEQDGALVIMRGGRIGMPDWWRDDVDYLLSTGWLSGLPYTISATFGYTTVPADIVECCLEIAVRIWRGRDASFSDVVGVEGSGAVGYNGALPAMVKRVLDHYKETTAGVW